MISLKKCTCEVAASLAMTAEAAWRLSEENLPIWGGVLIAAYFPGRDVSVVDIAVQLLSEVSLSSTGEDGFLVAPYFNAWSELDDGNLVVRAIRGVALWRADIAAAKSCEEMIQ